MQDVDPPLSILNEEVARFSRIVLGGKALPFWVTKEQAIHELVDGIMSVLHHIERHGNSWETYPSW